ARPRREPLVEFEGVLRGGPAGLLGQEPVGPLDETHERDRIREVGVLAGQVAVQDPPGPGAGTSDVDGDSVRDDLRERVSSCALDYELHRERRTSGGAK